MFSKIIEYLKGVFARMFGKDQITRVTGRQVTISSEMISKLDEWERMLKGQAPWVESDPDGVKSLGLESAICREFANIVISEMEVSLKNDELNDIFQNGIEDLNENMQTGLALGSFCIKPIADTGNVEYIPASRIIPIEFGDNGKLRCCAFVQTKPVGDSDVYYRLEIHELLPEGLHIMNRAFKGAKGEIGNEISLSSVPEWANLIPDVTYSGMNRMDFGYFKNPLPNHIDNSLNGVSIFNSAIESIRKADIQYGRIDWEYSSGERIVFADYSTIKKEKNGRSGEGFSFKAPTGKERLFVGISPAEDGNSWIDHSPAIRDANYIQGLNEYKREIEFNVSLAFGDLSKNEVVEKTAQEIKASKQRKYNMVNAIQVKLRACLEDFAWALAFYNLQFNSDIGFECVFHDSILTDEETERAQDRMDLANGIMSRVEYRKKWYGEDEDTARLKIAEIMAENASLTEGDIE